MSYRALALSLPLTAVLALPAAAGDPPGKPSEATLANYAAKCQACHMPDGNAALEPMNFADGKWIHGSDKAEVIKIISEGAPGTAMLPFSAQLSPAEIADLATYVRSFDKTLAAEKAKPAGKPAAKPAAKPKAAGKPKTAG